MKKTLSDTYEFKDLIASYNKCGINLLVGAGISKDPPSNAPIWGEMQISFLMAIFDRMEDEGWSISNHFPSDREAVQKLFIRPETFWGWVIRDCGRKAVQLALSSVNKGSPNTNHSLIKQILASGTNSNVLTTNFDTYIDQLLPESVPVWSSSGHKHFDSMECSRYIKLHGTIDSPSSLYYTLEHYDTLKTRNIDIFGKILAGKPLVILGYSGYDTDVLPVINAMINELPIIIAVRHPGSSLNQPIFELISKLENGYIIESPCNQILKALVFQSTTVNSKVEDSSNQINQNDYYKEAAKTVKLPLCSLAIMSSFAFVHDRSRVARYAKTAHDAAVDERYRNKMTTQELIDLHIVAGEALVSVGNDLLADIMFSEAMSVANEFGSPSQILRTKLSRDIVRGRNTNKIDKASSVRGANALSALQRFDEIYHRGEINERQKFEQGWQMGIMFHRAGEPYKAIDVYLSSSKILMDSKFITHLERGRFFLDFGGVAYETGAKEDNIELIEQSSGLLSVSVKESEEVNDWRTNAKALLMLSKIDLLFQQYNSAYNSIEAAETSAQKTDDKELRERINAQKTLLKLIISSKPKS